MIGYYKLGEDIVKLLPKESVDIGNNIYEICCPLIVSDISLVEEEVLCLYRILKIPVITYSEFIQFPFEKYCNLSGYLREFSKYLKLNVKIEILEEGRIGHLLRVAYYAYLLCRNLNLLEQETKNIYLAALFHDVGKYYIPGSIIGKKERLSDAEYNVMKKHTFYADFILKGFLSDEVLDIIKQHHERCDGSGYPRGIVPNMGAKILGIADSFDAMTSGRVYQDRRSLEEALLELSLCGMEVKAGGRGELFDREYVECFKASFL